MFYANSRKLYPKASLKLIQIQRTLTADKYFGNAYLSNPFLTAFVHFISSRIFLKKC